MAKKELKSITKSWKFEGCVFVQDTNGNDHKRNYYERKNTKGTGNSLYTYFEGNAYSFRFAADGNTAENVVNEGAYKDFIKSLEEEKNKPVVIPEVEKKPVIVIPDDGVVRHEKYNQIKACIDSDIPVFLVGPAGSGKNHTLEQIAEDLGLDFYFTNSVQQEYKLTGFIDAGGNFHETEFFKAFTKGGLFFLDEMDASIPEVLVLLNAAIANRYFEFPTGRVTAHEDFRVVAAGNTVGSGADEQYTGRLVLDQATLDRFAIIEFDYSRKIELALAKGNVELVDFIEDLRKQAKDKGIRATFSYRAISMVKKLEGVLEMQEVLAIAVFKGMDKDTMNTFKAQPMANDKYNKAMRELVRA
jgi:hypothetical protein